MHRQTDRQKQTDHNNPLLSSSVNKLTNYDVVLVIPQWQWNRCSSFIVWWSHVDICLSKYNFINTENEEIEM